MEWILGKHIRTNSDRARRNFQEATCLRRILISELIISWDKTWMRVWTSITPARSHNCIDHRVSGARLKRAIINLANNLRIAPRNFNRILTQFYSEILVPAIFSSTVSIKRSKTRTTSFVKAFSTTGLYFLFYNTFSPLIHEFLFRPSVNMHKIKIAISTKVWEER